MKAAYEWIGANKLVWAIGKNDREARRVASKRATTFHEEKIFGSYFEVCDATKEMADRSKSVEGGVFYFMEKTA